MSTDPNQPKRPPFSWDQFLPHADVGAIRAFAQFVRKPISAANVDRQGVVHIWIPPSLKDPSNLRISKWVPHVTDSHTKRFDPGWHAPEGTAQPALTFWLKPEALEHADRNELEARLKDFVGALAIQHDIPKLQAQLCVPSPWTLQQFDQPVAGAVVLAAPLAFAHKLEAVKKTILEQRMVAEGLAQKAPDTKVQAPNAQLRLTNNGWVRQWQSMHGHEFWQDRFKEASTQASRDIIAVRDVMDHWVEELPIEPVEIKPDKISFKLTGKTAKMLHGVDGTVPLNMEYGEGKPPPQVLNTKGLAIWLKPSFLHLYDGLSSKETLERLNDVRINGLAELLYRRTKVPLMPCFLNTEGVLKHSPEMASGAMVLMTDAAHQEKLFSVVYKELKYLTDIKNRSLVGHGSGDELDKKPAGPSR